VDSDTRKAGFFSTLSVYKKTRNVDPKPSLAGTAEKSALATTTEKPALATTTEKPTLATKIQGGQLL
jgi:hypothetical protein